VGVPPDVEPIALSGFQPVHRVAQSYLGSLWIALDKRRGDPGEPVLLRRLQLPEHTPEDARQCIVRAAHDAIALRSEGVLPVLEVIEQGDGIAVVHEHVEAEPLRSLQSWANLRALSFPASVSLKIVSELLTGLEALHAAHSSLTGGGFGGVSPDSVLVARDGRTLLADPLVASCACLLDDLGHHTAKLAYAAPEQVHAVAPLTPSADIFACGVLLWELLTGRRLLSGSRAAIERKLLEHNLPSLASNLRGDQHVSNLLIEVVGRALAADPESRPATTRAFADELAAAGHEVASREQVAQFIGKLSGQRLDRRNAAMRAKSAPDLSTSADWSDTPKSGTSGQRAAVPASGSGSFPARSGTPLGATGSAAVAARLFTEPSPPPSTEMRSSARPAVASNSQAAPSAGFAAVPAGAGSFPRAPSAPVPSSKPAPSSGAPELATSLGLGRRTVAGLGMPNHPALAVTPPFANITPPPFNARNPPTAAPAGAAPPASQTAASAAPAMPAATRATPPSVVTSAPPLPASDGPPKQQVAPRPSASPALAATVFLAPATSPSGQPPVPEAPAERLVPLVAASGRSTRSIAPASRRPASSQRQREGWALRLVPAGMPSLRALLGTLLACVALAGALAVVLVLRRPKDIEQAASPAASLAPAAPRSEVPGPHAPETAPAPSTVDSAPAAAAPAAVAGTAASMPAGAGEFDTKELDDVQLARLFALERRSNVPACKEPARKANAKTTPASARAASLELKAARHELTRGKPDRARPLLCSAIAHDPNNAAAFAALAGLALELGDPARAEEIAARGLEHKAHDGALLGVEGDALVLLSDIPGGRKLWLQTQSGSSDADRAKRLASTSRVLADRALRSSNYAGALTLYRRALILTEDGYQPSLGLAAALRKLDQARAALAWSERAAHAFPKDSQVQIAFGDALYQNGRKDAARLAWQAAYDAQPNNKLAARRLSKGKP
jgi:serine/threonine protein kinase/tetratricopeptide (TPR) repeat protein